MHRCYGCMRQIEEDICPHCGRSREQDNEFHQLPVGTVLQGQYTVGRVLGQGGFGITYVGWDEALDQIVAVKEFYPSSLVNRENTQSLSVRVNSLSMEAGFASGRERFLREARALAKLQDVPQIVGIFSCFRENDTAYIVMEFVRGVELGEYVKLQGGRLEPEETFRLMEPVLRAMESVHEAGLVHRDISPDNIMLDPRGGAKLLDFGAVRNVDNPEVDKALTRSTEAIVKHGFAPMEQYNNRGSLGPWTDEYALCATVYYCLTGRVPPDAMSRAMEEEELDWSGVAGLTEKQRLALEKGLAVRARDRFPDLRSLREALYAKEPPAPEKEQKAPARKKPSPPAQARKPRQTLPPQKAETPADSTGSQSRGKKASGKSRGRSIRLLWAAAVPALILGAVLLLKPGQTPPEPTGSAPETLSAETAPQETTPPETVPPPREATILSAGEFLIHNPLIEAAEDGGKYDFGPMLQHIAPYASEADWSSVTLSTTFAGKDSGYDYSGYPYFNCPDPLAEAAASAGFDMMVTATQFATGTGQEGLERTLEVIREAGMEPLGTREDGGKPRFTVREINGIRVGMIAYTAVPWVDSQGRPRLSGTSTIEDAGCLSCFLYSQTDVFIAEVKQLLAGMDADVTLMYLYWMEEYNTAPSKAQMQVAQRLCDLGIDVIIGSGARTVQPVELLESRTDPGHKTLCAYSLGNTLSNQRKENLSQMDTGHTEDSALLSITFGEDDSGRIRATGLELIPCWLELRKSGSQSEYVLLPLEEASRNSWQSSYGLTDQALADAEASFLRTRETVEPAMPEILAWLNSEPLPQPAAGLMAEDPLSALGVSKEDIYFVTFAGKSEFELYETIFRDVEQQDITVADLSAAGDGSVLGYFLEGVLVIYSEGGIDGSLACPGLFADCVNLEIVKFDSRFHTEGATSMEDMFLHCFNLQLADTETLDTRNVTTMRGMFDMSRNDGDASASDRRNQSLPTLNVTGWDVSQVTDMSRMFAGCSGLKEINVGGWDTGKVADMTQMFSDCSEQLQIIGVMHWDLMPGVAYEGFVRDGHYIDGEPWKYWFEAAA